MEKSIDVHGLSCPLPVVQTKKALETLNNGDTLEVIVDNPTSIENISRFAKNAGYKVEKSESKGITVLKIYK
ncbi:MAG: sulfurtransferase TusA family protein [Thermovenabulum sp.]|uniref:sulfurtransferase TusA family protein n=1 Tax=Thermovenabulum sp. TaxID=3100335 RepID=UPI003C7AF7A2